MAPTTSPQPPRQRAAAAAPGTATQPARAPVDRAKKFLQLGEKRMTKLLKALKHIGNLCTYDHTPEQVDLMFRTISKAVDAAAVRFTTKRTTIDDGFKF